MAVAHDVRVWVRDEFFAAGDAARVLQARSAWVDETVRAAFSQRLEPVFADSLALVAVGGYGRRELFPFSDVDLLLLTSRGVETPGEKAALSAFLTDLWDAGLRLSHSVRTPQECCLFDSHNIELSISLLDRRLLAGDRWLFESLNARFSKYLRARVQDLRNHLCRLARARHLKHQNTIHHMEPDVKESCGGLRDCQIVWWLDLLQNPEPDAAEWAMGAEDRHSRLSSERRLLFQIRCFLHYQTGRDSNRLTFELQDELAAQPFSPHRDPAAWMRDYFQCARRVHRAALQAMEAAEGPPGNLLAQFRDWRSRLSNAEFSVLRERVYFKSPAMLAADPEIVLRLFQFVARHGFRLAPDAERRLAEALPSLTAYFAESRPLWPALAELLSLPHAAMALEAMNEAGVLAAWLPEWKRIECLVVRDFFHRFTVDEHTLQALYALLDLRRTTDPARKRFAELLAETDKPEILMFALLLHDIGKGGEGGRHVENARPPAMSALERIQAPPAIREAVWELVERHLLLSEVMTSRDLDDPATAAYLAARAGTVEQLKRLTLLTYADVSAVNPGAMTPWRLEQLWRTYLCGHREFTRELDSDRIETPPAPSEQADFLRGFPTRYLRTHDAAQIERHLELRRKAEGSGTAVEIRRQNGVFAAEVVTRDRPGLLAGLAAALSGFGLNILKAEAFANRRGEVLDTFIFADPDRTLELNPSEVDRLRLTLERVAAGRIQGKELLRRRPKPAPPSRHSRLSPRVSFDAGASASATLVEIVAEDRPGLLHDLAAAISREGCNIEVVLIDTQAHKALDVFYVTKNGAKLSAGEMANLKQSLLAACRGLEE